MPFCQRKGHEAEQNAAKSSGNMEAPANSFVIKFRPATRVLTRAQLQRAPESLISGFLLDSDAIASKVDTLEVPTQAKKSSPGFAAWQNGTERLFQVRSESQGKLYMRCDSRGTKFWLQGTERHFSELRWNA